MPVHTGIMREILEEVRIRVRTQLKASPDTDSWDQASRDRLLLVQEMTRFLRLTGATVHSNGTPKLNGIQKPVEYTGEPCRYCGSLNVRRTGNCSVCDNCGESGGCS